MWTLCWVNAKFEERFDRFDYASEVEVKIREILQEYNDALQSEYPGSPQYKLEDICENLLVFAPGSDDDGRSKLESKTGLNLNF